MNRKHFLLVGLFLVLIAVYWWGVEEARAMAFETTKSFLAYFCMIGFTFPAGEWFGKHGLPRLPFSVWISGPLMICLAVFWMYLDKRVVDIAWLNNLIFPLGYFSIMAGGYGMFHQFLVNR